MKANYTIAAKNFGRPGEDLRVIATTDTRNEAEAILMSIINAYLADGKALIHIYNSLHYEFENDEHLLVL